MATSCGPPATATRPAPEGYPIKWLVALIPVALTVVGAAIATSSRLATVEGGLHEVDRRLDRMERSLDRLLDRKISRGEP